MKEFYELFTLQIKRTETLEEEIWEVHIGLFWIGLILTLLIRMFI